jgi:hypothetical protein
MNPVVYLVPVLRLTSTYTSPHVIGQIVKCRYTVLPAGEVNRQLWPLLPKKNKHLPLKCYQMDVKVYRASSILCLMLCYRLKVTSLAEYMYAANDKIHPMHSTVERLDRITHCH